MIQLTPQHSILVHVQPIDFRKGIDGLIGFCRGPLQQNPFSGMIFFFRNRSGRAIKILTYDGTGFWLMQKRFSQGVLQFWPKTPQEPLSAAAVMVILHQGQPGVMQSSWRALPSSAL